MSTTKEPDLLDFTQATELLGVSRPTLYRWIRDRRVKAFKAGRQWRFYRSDLDELLQESSTRRDRSAGAMRALAGALGGELPDAMDLAAEELAGLLLQAAVQREASSMHLRPDGAGGSEILLRTGGALRPIGGLDGDAGGLLLAALAERAGGLEALERSGQARAPAELDGRAIDLHLAYLPAAGGPCLVIRLRDRSKITLDLDRIYQTPEDRALADRLLGLRFGLVLVSGPTGSGKTTSAYALLHALAGRGLAVYTAESPVEVALEGAIQIPAGELGYPETLRRILAADPDVIFLGEAPDQETARLACKLATTGHLVLVQRHARSVGEAIASFARLADDPLLVASCLAAVSCQRLLRKTCPECRVQKVYAGAALQALGLPATDDLGLSEAVGCEGCVSGYRGRAPLYDVAFPDEATLDAIAAGASPRDLERAAIAAGMTAPGAKALAMLERGETTLSEWRRVRRA